MTKPNNEIQENVTSAPSHSSPARARVPFEVVTEEVEMEVDEVETDAIPSIFESTKNVAAEQAPPTETTPTPPVVEMSVESNETESVVEEPAAEVVVAEEPTVEEPAAEVVAAEEPTVEEPAAEVVAAEEPEVEETAVETITAESQVETASPANQKDLAPEQVEAATQPDEVFNAEEAIQPFVEMGLSPAVLEAIKTAKYTTPSPIQLQTVPHIMDGSDLIGQAETGSGKTAAFAWPILSRIDMQSRKPQCLILAPTRELAIQVTTAFRSYASGIPNFRTTTIYGGQSYETQFRALERGAHVVVGTPGRVIDHLSRRTLDLSDLKVFVLDEADEMLRMGFIDDIEQILSQTPRTQQTLCFSATMPAAIRRIAENYMREPVHVKIESDTATADTIEQTCIFVEPREKLDRLVRFLETEETEGVLVFTKTKNATNIVSERLIQSGIIASALNGDIAQHQRERTVGQLKSGKINVVVATDVAARGLDVPRISHVINYDFPHDTESYVHRIGRTGRAGRTGAAVLFVEPKEKGKLSRLQRATNQKIEPFKQKSLREINETRVANFKQRVVGALEDKTFEFFSKLVAEFGEESDLTMDQIAAGLAVVAQGDTPLMLEALKSPKSNWKKDRESKGRGRDSGPMQTYRVEVGRNDGVGPGNLVGAITNEANLTNADIGRIKLFDRFATIDLPQDIPEDLIQHLAGVYVGGRQLQISKSDQQYGDSRRDNRGGPRGRFQGGGGRGRDSGGGFRGRSNDRGPRSGEGRPTGYAGRKASENRSRDRDDRGPRSDRSARPQRDDRGGRGERSSSYEKRAPRPQRDDSSRRDDRAPRRESEQGGSTSPRSSWHADSKPREPREQSAWRGGEGRRDDRSRDRSSDKPGRKKTKAAMRTQAKKKPGATLNTPIKKYVKIRSAKKK